MAKVPSAGNVKTRMQPFLSEAQSAELATAFLKDAEQKVTSPKYEQIIAFSPANKKNHLEAILQQQYTLIEQVGKNLGERMFNAFKSGFDAGLDSIVMIGTDSPTFPARSIEKAFEYLASDKEIVLGESEDGGFYLIGLRAVDPELFEGVAWGSSEAFRQIRQNARLLVLKLETLPIWYDVDIPSDLDRLKKELALNPQLAPNTSEWLKKI